MTDPYQFTVATARLTRLAEAVSIIDEHADVNHRYRRLVDESARALTAEQIRLTQARGVAKKVMVLARAGGDQMRARLSVPERNALAAGLAQADELVYGHGDFTDQAHSTEVSPPGQDDSETR